MPADVIEHEVQPDPENDPEHPIPYLRVLDVAGYKTGGGADLSIIVASPLQADQRSQARLVDKIHGYLGYVCSEEFRADAGCTPCPDNTFITVVLHPASAPEIRDLLERCREWVRSNHAELVVRTLDDSDMTASRDPD